MSNFNSKVMKKLSCLLVVLAAFAFSFTAVAQKVYSVDYKSDADLVVYKVSYKSDASGNSGLWFFVDYKSDADKKVFFVDYKSDADLKIFFADYKSDAGWKNSSKKHLMY